MNGLFTKDTPEGAHLERSMRVEFEPVKILTVNTLQGWVDCQPEGDSRLIRSVPITALYEHPDGSGFFTMPRDGALATLLYPERGTPRLWAYRSEWRGDRGFAHNRPPMSPGDTLVQTASGAFLAVRDRGVIEALSTPGLNFSMTPADNRFFLRAENIDWRAMGGRFRWQHDRETAQTILRHDVTDDARQDIKLETSYGYHEDGALFRQHYQDPTLVPGREQYRQVTYTFGNLGGGQRVLMDVDDGSYRREIGETDDGTVVRTEVTGRNLTNRRWSKKTRVGRQPDGTIVHDRVEAGQAHVDLKVKDDGQVDLDVNGNLMLQIDREGNVTMTSKATVTINVPDAEKVNIGGKDGQELATKSFVQDQYNRHMHNSSMGPTGPPILPSPLKPGTDITKKQRSE